METCKITDYAVLKEDGTYDAVVSMSNLNKEQAIFISEIMHQAVENLLKEEKVTIYPNNKITN